MNAKITFNHILFALKQLALLNGVFLLMMTAVRVAFFFRFADAAHYSQQGYLFDAFLLGARFDLVVVAYVNSLATLSLLAVLAFKRVRYFDAWSVAAGYYYSVMYAVVFAILTVDIGFYAYFQNHINILIFGTFEDDTAALFSTIRDNYNIPLVAAGYIVLFVFIFYLCRHFSGAIRSRRDMMTRRYPSWFKIITIAALIALNTLAARGSLRMFPLGIMDAAITPDIFINKLSLNGVHTLIDAIDFRIKEGKGYDLIKEMGYEGRVEDAVSLMVNKKLSQGGTDALRRALTKETPRNDAAERTRPNVIVIVMEGFGTDLMQYNSGEFNVLGELKKHFDEDHLFTRFLSGDVGTIGSLEAVLLSAPKRPKSKPVTQSVLAFQRHPSGAANPFKEAGYDTYFEYGGSSAWRNLDKFLPELGFDHVEGDGAMDPSYLKNQWGVYDEFLFDHIYKRLARGGKPKFIFALTTSNHPPYSLPPTYTPLPLRPSPELDARIKGDKEQAQKRFMTYQYANQRLGEFITRVKNSPWGKSTIIAVTGDHNFWDVFDYGAERYADLYGVPFYIYIPPQLKQGKIDANACGSHIDIMPTLYSLSLSSRKYVSIGRDLFDAGSNNIAFNVDGFIIGSAGAAKYTSQSDTIAPFAWDAAGKRTLSAVLQTKGHEEMLSYYKAALASTDYLLKNPFPLELPREK